MQVGESEPAQDRANGGARHVEGACDRRAGHPLSAQPLKGGHRRGGDAGRASALPRAKAGQPLVDGALRTRRRPRRRPALLKGALDHQSSTMRRQAGIPCVSILTPGQLCSVW